jgi:glutathione S-transferase
MPELISFVLCPFVQRSVIALKEKGVPFRLVPIDLDHPPDWLAEISPLGKVPVLRVGETVLFESQVICEYLDETHPPSLHPADPLARARDRAWIEVASQSIMGLHEVVTATDEPAYRAARDGYLEGQERLAGAYSGAPLWHGTVFSLVDAAYAPLFMRQRLLGEARAELAIRPPLEAWADALLVRPSVRDSVPADFARRYRDWCRARGSLVLA